MKECELCGSFEELLNAIHDARPVEVCRRCADFHNSIVLEQPSKEKLKDVERLFSVRERLEEAAQIKERERLKRISETEKKTAFPETLSYSLRKEREKAGLSREKLADELGLSSEEVEQIEAGDNPSQKALKRYEQFFKRKFELVEEKKSAEQGIDFKDEKATLRDLMERAKTFFTGKKSEEVEVKNLEEAETKAEGSEGEDEVKIY